MPYTAYNSVAKMGLAASGAVVKEQYVPLWIYSSGQKSAIATSASASNLLAKGGTGYGVVGSSANLHTLNSLWNISQKFAFEASIAAANASYTAYAAMWDITAGAIVSGSTISTTSTATSVLRSGNVSLIPGHAYGVTVWTANATGGCYLTKAHLVAIN